MVQAVLCSASLQSAWAQVGSGVAVNPQRVIFEGRQRSTTVTLSNRFDSPVTYRIYFINMRMTEQGKLEVIEKPESSDKFSEGMIRYSPREITVPPKGFQTVRLMVRKPRNLPPGEYRSHLVFKALPPSDTSDIEAQVLGDSQVRVQLVTVLSLSIPIIVRHGDLSVNATLTDLKFSPGEANTLGQLAFTLNRQGDASLYGDIQVMFQPAEGDSIQVASSKGVAIYSSVPFRKMQIPLNPVEGINIKQGTLKVIYRNSKKNGKIKATDAEATLAVQ